METKIEDTLTEALDEYSYKVRKDLKAICDAANKETVRQVISLQRDGNWFWTNRTFRAADNISGQTKLGTTEITSEIGHGENVPYGFFLETNQQGKFGFLDDGLQMLKFNTLNELKNKGFEFEFTLTPYSPTKVDRIAAQRKNN